jgi:hypothetical protein
MPKKETFLKTAVVHCQKEPYDVYIGRPSKWGNPFRIGVDGTREETLEKYHQWILEQEDLLKDLPELQGKVLGCWCDPKPCHGNILAKLADVCLEDDPERQGKLF